MYGNTEGGQVKLSWSLENKMETCPAASPSAKVCLSDVLVQQIKSFLKHCQYMMRYCSMQIIS